MIAPGSWRRPAAGGWCPLDWRRPSRGPRSWRSSRRCPPWCRPGGGSRCWGCGWGPPCPAAPATSWGSPPRSPACRRCPRGCGSRATAATPPSTAPRSGERSADSSPPTSSRAAAKSPGAARTLGLETFPPQILLRVLSQIHQYARSLHCRCRPPCWESQI